MFDLSKKNGFTLVELLVVISIIAILATIGGVVYNGMQQGARDSRRKADVEFISKAYEVTYSNNGQYSTLAAANFSGGSVPKPPEGGDYFNVIALSGSGFKACAALESHPTRTCNSASSTCYCKSSAQGLITSGQQITGTGSELGLGDNSLAHPSFCDPNGTLDDGLVGYWRMDEPSWNGSAGEVKDATGINNGRGLSGVNTAAGKFLRAGNFDGIDDYVSRSSSAGDSLNPLTTITISAWINPSTAQQGQIVSRNGPYALYMNANRTITLSIYAGSTLTWSSTTTTDTVSLSQWSHVLGTYDGTTMKIYINGSLSKSQAHSQTGNMEQEARTFFIGYGDPGFNQYFAGKIDEVRVYNRAISGSEVTSLYSGGNGCVP